MKALYKFFGIILLSIAVFSGCQESTSDPTSVSNTQSPLLKGSGPSASGQGRIAGTDRTFAFSAVTHPDGSVSGQGQLTYTHNGNDVKIHFTIDCISVVDNQATMSGIVTNSNVFEPGGPCYFKVVDNGEGKNASPDEMTGFLFCEPDDPDLLCAQLTCDNDLPLELFLVENGNIQVKQ
jgi:hypothetical protein